MKKAQRIAGLFVGGCCAVYSPNCKGFGRRLFNPQVVKFGHTILTSKSNFTR